MPTFHAVHKPHTAEAESDSQTFSYTGSSQTFTVPSGVSTITIQAWGAQGCAGHFQGGGYPGGKGGYATGSLSVSAGNVLYVFVGQQPTARMIIAKVAVVEVPLMLNMQMVMAHGTIGLHYIQGL